MKLLACLLAAGLLPLGAAPKKPVYVGARVCGSCHAGKGMGNQYSRWLHSRHAMAYAALAKPEAAQIATISGLRQKPQEAPICLGCHATAFDVEEWQKDDTFHMEDGVQCEMCHGPGSEYMTESVMRNREEAMKAGLRIPTQDDCMNCHIEKGSHVAVLHTPLVDIRKAWAAIAHPTPENAKPGAIPKAKVEARPGPRYIGSAACGKCHRGEAGGHQWSLWRMGPHARAWAVLSTASGFQQAAKRGVEDQFSDPRCLKCHATGFLEGAAARTETATIDEGVGCESCHGPGSEYAVEAVMRDRPAARAAGLAKSPRQACAACHQGAKFNLQEALRKIAHPTRPAAPVDGAAHVRYKTPLNLAMRPGGREIYVACEASDSVVVVDPARKIRVAEIAVGGNPADVAFSPDGRLAFVSNRHDDTVSVIDAAARKVVRTLEVHDEPHGVLTDREGRLLYVLNTSSDDIWVFSLPRLERVKSLSAGRGPWSLALSPGGEHLLVTNMYANFAFRAPFDAEATLIETGRGAVEERFKVPGANLMMGVDWHPSGKFALTTLNRTKTLVPMTRLLQGWTITNGLGVVWRDGRVDEVLLDEPNLGFADATDVAITGDGRHALVTSSGTDRVAVVDIGRLLAVLERATPRERERVLPNHLGMQAEFVVKHIATGASPRGVLVPPAGRWAYVANSLDDSLTVIDLVRMEASGRIDLGGPKTVTRGRFGERLFHSADITFRKQYSCHSCHPDGHVDGLSYDIEADGIGFNPVDNRTLRGILDTAPFKWAGTNPSLQRQCGARLAMFFTRLLPFTPEQLSAIDYYITTILRPPNRYRALGARLTPAQRRGKLLFERATTNDGRTIPAGNRCITCHFPPYYTNRKVFDVGTRHPLDRMSKLDVPHLNNIYDSAPYLHNGMAPTLEEIWTVHNPDDLHGQTNDMTKDQLNELIEYLKTL
ncbi:MAG: beta-propeller fold lactonase family protein [Bryobacterales bacterium]|nr:beta-propeller fold lactonase family protein [Bryobacterales bacterium]